MFLYLLPAISDTLVLEGVIGRDSLEKSEEFVLLTFTNRVSSADIPWITVVVSATAASIVFLTMEVGFIINCGVQASIADIPIFLLISCAKRLSLNSNTIAS